MLNQLKLAALAAGLASSLCYAGGEEIRWIAASGGSWSDAANWDLGRVPGDLDDVIIDLKGEHTITFCGNDNLWSTLKVINGDITLDGCGGSINSRYESYDRDRKRLSVGNGADRPTSVLVTNGILYPDLNTSGLGVWMEESVGVSNADGWPATLTFDETAEVGFVRSAGAGPNGTLIVAGDIPISYSGSFGTSEGGRAIVSGRVGSVPGFVNSGEEVQLNVNGELLLDGGRFSGFFAFGSGTVRMINNAFVGVDYTEFTNFIVEDESNLVGLGNGFRFVNVDLSNANPGLRVTLLGQNWAFYNTDCTLRYGPANLNSPAVGRITEEGYGWSLPEEVLYESDVPLEPGFQGAIGEWDIRSTSESKDSTEFRVAGEAAETTILRPVSITDPVARDQLVTIYVLGTGPDWCPADLDFNGQLDFFDIARFLQAFNEESPWANTNSDFYVDFDDVLAFLDIFTAGCP